MTSLSSRNGSQRVDRSGIGYSRKTHSLCLVAARSWSQSDNARHQPNDLRAGRVCCEACNTVHARTSACLERLGFRTNAPLNRDDTRTPDPAWCPNAGGSNCRSSAHRLTNLRLCLSAGLELRWNPTDLCDGLFGPSLPAAIQRLVRRRMDAAIKHQTKRDVRRATELHALDED